jgi:hypothetical protein
VDLLGLVAFMLLCGKWMTRLWTLQEICLAKNGLVLTALGPVKFKEIIQVLCYLSGHQEDHEDITGPFKPSILRTVHKAVEASRFQLMYCRLIFLVFIDGDSPSLTTLISSCHGRRAGNDIDYARAFFPLLGLQWKIQNSREEGMINIYQSKPYQAKRLILMFGSPRFCVYGWAPSYLTGLVGTIISPDEPLGDVEWRERGLARKWYTYKVSDHQPPNDADVLNLVVEKPESNPVVIACRLDPREAWQSLACLLNAISEGHAFTLANQELDFQKYQRSGHSGNPSGAGCRSGPH